ncbi:MAG: signal transduction histidine kinase [Sphingobacteriales bacterium]|jgi:signal transduction histidine kinase
MPLKRSDGNNLGTLCVMDAIPKTLNDKQKFALKVLSEQVMTQMELNKTITTVKATAAHLVEKNDKEALLNQLLNRLLLIIAHDFRSPLASIKGMLNLFSTGLIGKKDAANLTRTLSSQVENTLTFLEDLLLWTRQKIDGI